MFERHQWVPTCHFSRPRSGRGVLFICSICLPVRPVVPPRVSCHDPQPCLDSGSKLGTRSISRTGEFQMSEESRIRHSSLKDFAGLSRESVSGLVGLLTNLSRALMQPARTKAAFNRTGRANGSSNDLAGRRRWSFGGNHLIDHLVTADESRS